MPPKTDEAFLREVDEELRRDQIVGVWTNHGRLILGAIGAGLLIFAAVLGWRYWSNSKAEGQAVKLQTALDSIAANKPAEASAALTDLDTSGAPGYSAVARMTEANQLFNAGKTKEAAAKFAAIAGDTALGKPARDYALIRQTSIEFDGLAPQIIIDRLKPLAAADSAWLGSAGEMVAMAYLRLNKPNEARAMFKKIAGTETVPESIRQRAVQGMDAVDVGTTDQKGK
ncbi:tetratricopeptide repeat protein [Sphingomonas panacisoli]|uniref:tetratricopeptide repeat protein n=1 Tax=Sphingomonas panacisoli TaxID=1813879 RepID=UPI001F00F03B|nr:tetratricopeptide repeat protein [Sphingomonas panacisoli]